MSDFLDRELLHQSFDQAKMKYDSDKAGSLTSQVFHADDKKKVNGRITFKPLTMETVDERDEDTTGFPNKKMPFNRNNSVDNLKRSLTLGTLP